MPADPLIAAYTQGGSMLLLLVSGGLVIRALWTKLERQDRDAREDRTQYLEAVRAQTAINVALQADLKTGQQQIVERLSDVAADVSVVRERITLERLSMERLAH